MAPLSVWARRAAVCGVLAAPVVAWAGWPLGSFIDESGLVDVTAAGFASLEDVVTLFLPGSVALPDVVIDEKGGCVDPCSLWGGNCEACVYTLYVEVTEMSVAPTVEELLITPAEQVLNLDGSVSVQLNSASAPATLVYEASGFLIPISDTCDVYTNPINVTLDGSIELDTAPDASGVDVDGDGAADTKLLDATIPPLTWSWDADDTDIKLIGCGTASVINTLNDALDFFGFANIYEIVLDQIEPNGPSAPAGQIEALIDSLPGLIEPVIEDAFSQLFLNTTVDLLGVPLTLTLWPDDVEVHAEGMRVALTSVTSVEPDPCIAEWDPGGSLVTPSTPPAIGEVPSGLTITPHAGLYIDDDFVNQLLYGAWSGGLLCMTLSEENDPFGLPIAINSALLSIVAPGAFTDVIPEVQPLEIRTEPREAPVVGPPGPHDVSVVDDGLGLNFLTVVEGRQTRVLGIDLAVDVGADLAFDPSNGNLSVAIDLGQGAITPHVGYNEFRPDESKAIASSFGTLINGVVVPLAAPYVEGLTFAIPSLEGVGVVDMDLGPAGPNGDYIGAFATTGAVPYSSAGCTSGGGCDTSSCGGGCSSGGGALFVAWPLVVAAIRRRTNLKGAPPPRPRRAAPPSI